MWYFSVLQSKDKIDYFYKGSTNDLRRRLQQHNNGLVDSTRPYKPFKVVYYEANISEKDARLRESSVKTSGSVWTPLMKRIKGSLK